MGREIIYNASDYYLEGTGWVGQDAQVFDITWAVGGVRIFHLSYIKTGATCIVILINLSQLKGFGKLAPVSGLFVSCDPVLNYARFLFQFHSSPPPSHPFRQWTPLLNLEVPLGEPSGEVGVLEPSSCKKIAVHNT